MPLQPWRLGGCHIEASEELDGIEFYRKKDKVMIEECDCGFFVWDPRSLGTKLNRMDLKRLGKPIFTYRSSRLGDKANDYTNEK